jgi:nucleotide-binding universal stress UspA family protein
METIAMKQFNNIVYVCEPSAAQGSAIARAASLAENNQASLAVMDVIPVVGAGLALTPSGLTSDQLQSAMIERRRMDLDAVIAPYRLDRDIQIEVRVGRTFVEVIRAVLCNQYDLVIKPAENPSFIGRLFGSNDMHLLRKCPCPVWLTGPDETTNYKRILAAVDFDVDDISSTAHETLNQRILEIASSLALSDFAELHLAHAWDAPAEMMIRTWTDDPDTTGISYVESERLRHEAALSRLQAQLRDLIGEEAEQHLAPQFHLRRGDAATVIPEIAKQLQADLVVMGTIARTGIAGLLIGNTAEAILEQLQFSVLAVKPAGFVSPITRSD